MDLYVLLGLVLVAVIVLVFVLIKYQVTEPSESQSNQMVGTAKLETVTVGKTIGRGSVYKNGDENNWEVQQGNLVYYIRTHKTLEETVNWLDRYSQYGVRCADCGALIFPGVDVGKLGKDYYHGYPCALGGTAWGVIDKSGIPVSTRESGLSIVEEVFKTGEMFLGTIEVKRLSLDDIDYILQGVLPIDKS